MREWLGRRAGRIKNQATKIEGLSTRVKEQGGQINRLKDVCRKQAQDLSDSHRHPKRHVTKVLEAASKPVTRVLELESRIASLVGDVEKGRRGLSEEKQFGRLQLEHRVRLLRRVAETHRRRAHTYRSCLPAAELERHGIPISALTRAEGGATDEDSDDNWLWLGEAVRELAAVAVDGLGFDGEVVQNKGKKADETEVEESEPAREV